MPNFDVIAPNVGSTPGLLMGLDPSYQARQLAVQQGQLGLGASQAFKDGLPVDGQGNTDWGAATNRLMQLGAYDQADKLATFGLQQGAISAAQRNATGVGQYGGAPGGAVPGLAPPASGGPVPTGGVASNAAPPAGASSAAPGDYLSRLALVENGGRDGGDPSSAGALGRYQFTASTWNGLAQRYPDLNLTPDGRTDPAQQARAITAFSNDNASALGRSGFQATLGNLYLAHFAGAGGATAALQADPKTPVVNVLGGAAVKANPFLDGMTAGGLVGWANSKMADVDPSTVPGSPGGMSPDVAAAMVRLRSGQGSAADGAVIGAYQRSKAQGQASTPDDSTQPISFGGPASPSAAAPLVDPTHAAAEPIRSVARAAVSPSAIPDAARQPTAEGAPVGDSAVMAARQRLAAAQDADPSSLTPAQQQQLTADTGTVDAYTTQHAQPAASLATASTTMPSNVSDALARLQNRQGNAADSALWGSFQRGQGQGGRSAPLGVPGASGGDPSSARAFLTQQASDGIPRPVSFGSSQDAAPGGVHPFGPGSTAITRSTGPSLRPPSAVGGQPPAPGGAIPPAGGVPGLAPPPVVGGQPPQGGGLLSGTLAGAGSPAPLPISLNGGVPAAPPPSAGGIGLGQAAPAPAPMPTQPTAPPPVSAAPATSTQMLDPSFGGLVPAAWLKAGHTAGDWVNYARQQAAINGGLPFGAGKANEEGWSKIADGLSSAIDKSNVYTPEQRNARDDLAIKYETDRERRKEQLRLSADTDLSRVDFAGKQAAATAAGTEQGKAPYTFLPTQPVPGGPTVYRSTADLAAGGGAIKDQPAVFSQKQEALGKLDGELQGQFQQRQVAQERIGAMSNLLETFQSGAGADAKAAAVAAVRAAGFDMPDSATASPSAVEQFSKNATANVFQNAKDMGGRVLVSELDGLQKANANPNMQPASNAAILAQQKGLLNWEDAYYNDRSQWRQANPYATDASTFETAWAKAHPASAYVDAAKKDISPLGVPLPPKGQLVGGQAYLVKGMKTRWDAGSSQFVPFSGTTAPALPGSTATQPPAAGARQASDGNWYTSDPNRPGKFLMVTR